MVGFARAKRTREKDDETKIKQAADATAKAERAKAKTKAANTPQALAAHVLGEDVGRIFKLRLLYLAMVSLLPPSHTKIK